MLHRRHLASLLLAFLLFPAQHALAHPEGLSGLRLLVWPDHARAVLTVHTRDMSNWFPPRQYPDYVPQVCAAMKNDAGTIIELQADGVAIPPTNISTSCPEVGLLKLEATYPLPPRTAHLLIWSPHLKFLPANHQQVLQADDMRGQPDTAEKGHYLKDDTLDVNNDSSEFPMPAGPAPTTHSTTSPTTATTTAAAAAAASAAPPSADPTWLETHYPSRGVVITYLPILVTAAGLFVFAFLYWRSRHRRGKTIP